MDKFKHYLLARLQEPSTWYGVIQVLAAFGLLHFTDEQTRAVMSLLGTMLGTGAAAIITADKS